MIFIKLAERCADGKGGVGATLGLRQHDVRATLILRLMHILPLILIWKVSQQFYEFNRKPNIYLSFFVWSEKALI